MIDQTRRLFTSSALNVTVKLWSSCAWTVLTKRIDQHHIRFPIFWIQTCIGSGLTVKFSMRRTPTGSLSSPWTNIYHVHCAPFPLFFWLLGNWHPFINWLVVTFPCGLIRKQKSKLPTSLKYLSWWISNAWLNWRLCCWPYEIFGEQELNIIVKMSFFTLYPCCLANVPPPLGGLYNITELGTQMLPGPYFFFFTTCKWACPPSLLVYSPPRPPSPPHSTSSAKEKILIIRMDGMGYTVGTGVATAQKKGSK